MGDVRLQDTCGKCQWQVMLVPLRVTCEGFCSHPSLEDLDYSLPCLYSGMAYTLHKMHFEQEVLHYVPQTLVLISLL